MHNIVIDANKKQFKDWTDLLNYEYDTICLNESVENVDAPIFRNQFLPFINQKY